MTTATAQIGAPERGAVRYGSISRGRKRTLYWSYFFLVLFVIFFLMPPVYMLITSLKTSAEIGAVTNPWWVYHPTLQNYIDLLSQAQFLTFFKNSALVAVIVVAVTMVVSILAASPVYAAKPLPHADDDPAAVDHELPAGLDWSNQPPDAAE